MAKNKKKLKLKEAKRADKFTGKTAVQTLAEDITQTDDPFDLGGMASRDLKKNLGCG